MPETATGRKQCLSKLTSLFNLKKAASKQAQSGDAGRLATPSMQEAAPADLIPAVRKPSDVQQQADPPGVVTTAAAKPASQVGI